MTEEPNIKESADFDDEEALFDEKPGSRLVWIVPSVILNLLVFMIWFLMPEKEHKEVKSRDMLIKSEQAEQLKQFVEDSNLLELRAEVRRLQDIKQAMASIRAEDMDVLKEFESTMRSSLDSEALQVLAGLQECHQAFAAGQTVVMQGVTEIAAIFDAMQPLVEKKDIAAMVPYVERIIQARRMLYAHLENMNEFFLQLPARQDGADSVFSWMKDAGTLQLWEKFVDLQERMFTLQGKCYEEQSDFPYTQDSSLSRIAKEGPEFGSKLQKSIDDEKSAWLDYENNRKKYTGEIETTAAAGKELERAISELTAKLQKIKDEKDRLNKERAAIGTKSVEEKKQREELQKRIKEQEQLYSIAGGEKRSVERKLSDVKKKRSGAEAAFKRLKEPSSRWEKDRERVKERMDSNLNALSAKAGDVAAQAEACRLEQETLQVIQALVEMVQKKSEAAK